MPSRIDIGPEGGPFVAVNENNGDLELQDINGNVIAKWDETAGHWDFANTSLTNLAAVTTENGTFTESITGDGLDLSNDPSSQTRWITHSNDVGTIRRAESAVEVVGDNTDHDIGQIDIMGTALVVGISHSSVGKRFADLLMGASAGSTSVIGEVNRSSPGLRDYSMSGSTLQVAIDESGETYDVVVSTHYGRR